MGGIVSGLFGGASAASDAGAVQAQAAQAGVAETRRQFNITQENLDPFLQAGTGALQTQQALLGQLGPEAAAAAMAQFQEGPGVQAAQASAQKNLLQNASAIGGLGGGNVRSALVQQGVDFSNQSFGDFQNRLGALSGSGQTTATNLGQLGSQSSANISNLLQAGGQAQASGILGAQQANQHSDIPVRHAVGHERPTGHHHRRPRPVRACGTGAPGRRRIQTPTRERWQK